ncbi:MAG: hypothetical protein ACRD2R_08300 [Terriglobales bacterium]
MHPCRAASGTPAGDGCGYVGDKGEEMNKVLLGVIVGGILGIFDGLTAWFTPAVRDQMTGIVIGSTFKGILAGVMIGAFARKVRSLPLVLAFGGAAGLLLAYLVAAMPDPSGKHYYFEIMLPGSIVGLLVGYATQKYGRAPQTAGS